MQQTQTTPIKMTLADWAFNDNQFIKALNYYQDVLAHEPFNADANLGGIESLIALGDKKKAHQMLEQLQNKEVIFSLDMQRRKANAWNGVGEPQKALIIFNHLKQVSIHAAPARTVHFYFVM